MTGEGGRRVRRAVALLVVMLMSAFSGGWATPVVGLGGELGVTPATAFAAPARVDAPARRLTFGFVGDIHTHRGVNRSADRPDGTFDYSGIFGRITPMLSWFDVALCHMEQPLSVPGTPVYVASPQLSASRELARDLAVAGFDRCGTASNHAVDRVVEGLEHTLDAMDAAGLGHAGTARTPEERGPSLFVVSGVLVAHIAYTFVAGYLPPGESWRVNVTNTAKIIADARAAREAGAQIVILDMEWGVDKIIQPTYEQRMVANAVTASGDIDLIIRHRAHVLQPISQVNGTWVVWGLGSIVSDNPSSSSWPAESQDAAVVMVDVTVDGDTVTVGRPLVYPTWCDKQNGHVIYPVSAADDPSIPLAKRVALSASRERSRAIVGDFFAPGVG